MRLFIFILDVLMLFGSTYAHGGMKFPVTRNLVHSHYCPHCANGDGVCGNGKGSQWTTSQNASILHGDYETSRTVLYREGTIEVEIWVTVGHAGIMSVELCENPQETIASDCFKRLKRDPTDERVSPYLEKYPEIVFFLTDGCMTLATLDSPAKVRFLVPEGSNPADHGILRMYWNTGNSCSPHRATTSGAIDVSIARFETRFNGADCTVATSSLGLCGEDCPKETCGGEKFINCADVAIHLATDGNHVTSDKHETIPIGNSTITTTPTSVPLSTTETPAISSSTSSESASSVQSTSSLLSQFLSSSSSPSLLSSTSRDSTSSSPSSSTARSTGPFLSNKESTSESCVAPVGDEEMCKKQVKGVYEWVDTYCQDRCRTIGSGEDETGRKWCAATHLCSLTDCVLGFYSTVCVPV